MNEAKTSPITALRYDGESTDYVLEGESCWLEGIGPRVPGPSFGKTLFYIRRDEDSALLEAFKESAAGGVVARLELTPAKLSFNIPGDPYA